MKNTVTPVVSLVFEVTLTLNETELRALDALVGYGTKEFLTAFYEKMGKAYLQPHEKGIIDLFEKVNNLRPAIAQINDVKVVAYEVVKRFTS